MTVDRASGCDRRGSSHEVIVYRVFVSIDKDIRNYGGVEFYYRLTALVQLLFDIKRKR